MLAQRLGEADRWITAPLPAPPAERTFDSYQLYWEHLGALAVGTLDRLIDYVDTHPEDAATRSTYQGLLAAL